MNSLNNSFFKGNRERLAKLLPDSLIVLPAHSSLQYSADQAYPFRQESNFWYLTGLRVADAILIIDTLARTTKLLLPEQNEYQLEWDGVNEHEAIMKSSGIAEIGVKSELTRILKAAKKRKLQVSGLPPLPEIVEPYGFYANPARAKLADSISATGLELVDIRAHLAGLRQIKQTEEIGAIRQAITITGQALTDVKARLDSFKTEKDIEHALAAGFYAHGGDGHSFTPIIASGKNAATIHYVDNEAPLDHESLVLLDVGTLYNGYASDISRTWAIGSSTKRQNEIWQACLDIQEFAFQQLKPGVLMKAYQEEVERYAQTVFKRLGCSMYGKQFPHGFSHFLGIDVHDAGRYDEPLAPGSIITVEPGLYLPDEGIGVRVEDNVLITETGIEILSKDIPKSL